MFLSERFFVVPPPSAFANAGVDYFAGFSTYASYNYLRPGLIARLKRQRFEVALRLAAPYFGQNVIDMGCADGVFLPSLSLYFRQVVGIDQRRDFIEVAERARGGLGLRNVRLICNDKMSTEALRTAIGEVRFSVLFLLETLEHVGTAQGMYESKVAFLREQFALLPRDGVIIVSVPVMVGLPFLLKHAVQVATRMHHEPVSPRELFDLAVRRDSSRSEPRWSGGHLGFNHLKLDDVLSRHFRVLRRKSMFFSVFYVLTQKQ